MSVTSARPPNLRKSSRVPGDFDADDEASPMKAEFGDAKDQTHSNSIQGEPSLPPLPTDDSSLLHRPDESRANQTVGDMSMLDERDMRNKLMDVESSFLPELSHLGGVGQGRGADDTYLCAVPNDNLAKRKQPPTIELHGDGNNENALSAKEPKNVPPSPLTPPGAYKTPAPERQHEILQGSMEEDSDIPVAQNTSSLETMSSSPTAAAAARTVSRVISMTTMGGYETAEDRSPEQSPTKSVYHNTNDESEETPRKQRDPSISNTGSGVVSPTRSQSSTNLGLAQGDGQDPEAISERRTKRPKFLTSRQSTQRFSYSSLVSSNTDTASDATLGADFALQSGGAVPANNVSHGTRMGLSRSTSLGSMASGISALSDGEGTTDRRTYSGVTDANLSTLDEEDHTASSVRHVIGRGDENAPLTPKASIRDLVMPTDTIIAEHIKDIQVPGTLARQYREHHRGLSPERKTGAPTPSLGRSGRTMTLKEQSSTIDRLSKENFDLKMKIHFLDQALNRRSEDGIKEMISENVDLKSDQVKLQKDNQAMRRTIRDLEKKLKDKDEGERGPSGKVSGSDQDKSPIDEEEVIYLKERIETYEIEIEKLRTESIARESEKRRLAEMVKSLGDGRAVGSDAGAREERDMWKDMLDAETAAREQADEDNRKLRDEIARVKSEAFSANGQAKTAFPNTKRNRMSSVVSQSTGSERDLDRNGASNAASSTLVELELLKHENAELRKEVSAQTSMLTSRNREKERLYQEIEDLKLQRRGDGVRSIAGDSIFERSASRAQARSASRTGSDGTRVSRTSDNEREKLENKNGELRDQVSTLKLENQNLKEQLEDTIADLEALDRAYQGDVDQANEELQLMQTERDDALKSAEEREKEFQALKVEAQEEIDALGDELDEKADEYQRLEVDLRNQDENFQALQSEMRSASEGILRLEEDAQANLQNHKSLQQELDDSNRELESLEKSLFEANSKVQRLTVQAESSQNEIAFLREEQDGDKIKIGDLESALKTHQTHLQSEKDRTKDLDRRLGEERHQREVVGSKEKQEVQRILNDLNREATAAKDEVRKLKKALSSREIEATTWKERLMELENSLREALGDLNGTRSSLLNSITKMQRELDSTAVELDATRRTLDEKDALLKNRDSLLESHGLESRKLADLLDRERQGRRADKHSFEQSLKSHQQASRTISQNNSRISELESARQQDRKRLAALDQQYKDQLSERNSVLLNIWKRLSSMCGPDWAHSNSLISGNLPSQEVIGNMLFWPGFSRNLLLAAKQVEGLIGGFRTRIKTVESNLWKEYQSLEHTLESRIKKLDRLEDLAQNLRNRENHHPPRPTSSSSSSTTTPEMAKLRGENRLLKAELSLLQSHSRNQSRTSGVSDQGIPPRGASKQASASAAMAATLIRHHSTSAVEGAINNNNTSRSNSITSRTSIPPSSAMLPPMMGSTSGEPGQDRWIHRLRELEKRLKAEREARLLDRSGARKRLEERSAENEELRAELEREKMRSGLSSGGSGG